MTLLLDTHVFLWLQTEPERLGERLALVEAPETTLLLSAVSSWEIGIKHALGRLPLPEAPAEYVPSRMRRIGAQPLAISHAHGAAAGALPPLHRDPFDRMLVAQCVALGATILTADAAVARYDVDAILLD